jgi:apurinic endonuclease APN1
MASTSLIGPSVSIKEGAFNALLYSHMMGGNTTQIYLGSNISAKIESKSKKIDDGDIAKVNKFIKQHNHHLIIHGVLAMNLCSKPSTIKHYIYPNIEYDLNIVERMGGIGVVLHFGFQNDTDGRDIAYKNMATNVIKILDLAEKSAPNTKLILETPAGKKNQIATTTEDFAELWNLIPKVYYKRLGICVDTAHIFSSGIDIRTTAGVNAYLDNFNKLIGLKHLVCFHINDSKVELNSRKDLHEGIGQGYIYGKDKGGSLEGLYTIHQFATKFKIPMALETHKAGFFDVEQDMGKYAQEVEQFRKWDKSDTIPRKFSLVDKDKDTLKKEYRAFQEKYEADKPIIDSGLPNLIITKEPKNIKLAEIFNKLRIQYQSRGDFIRGNSYQRVVYQIKVYPDEITSGEQVVKLKGIGPKIIEKINEILSTGSLKLLDNLVDDLPEGSGYDAKNTTLDINTVFGFGPKKVKDLAELDIHDINQLKTAVEKDKVKLTSSQHIGLRYHDDLQKRIPRTEAKYIVDKITTIVEKEPTCSDIQIYIAGSYPSGKASSKDIDVLITSSRYKTKEDMKNTSTLKNVVQMLTKGDIVKHTLSIGDTKFLGLVQMNDRSPFRHMDIRLVPKSVFPFAYFHYTSGGEFNKMIRDIAKSKGYKLSEWGIEVSDSKKAKISIEEFKKVVKKVKTDKDIFNILEVDYISQEDRR